jgi:hypothetical protein
MLMRGFPAGGTTGGTLVAIAEIGIAKFADPDIDNSIAAAAPRRMIEI